MERLLKEGCHVRAFVHYNSFNNWGWLDSFSDDQKKEIEVFAGDIRDPFGVKKAIAGIDVVFHLAALIGIPYSYHSPCNYVETNIQGTLNILQAVKEEGTARLLTTSTSEVYGTATYVPIDEKHPRQAQSPYSATKIAADAMAESFYRSFGVPVTIVRPFNTYGPRQSARAVIPTIMTQLLSGKKEIKLGSLAPTRDLVYVKDTVEGFLAIAGSEGAIGKEINIATGNEIAVGDLARKLIALISPDACVVSDHERIRPGKSEVERLLGSNERIRSLTGWKPIYSRDEGLKETLEWFGKEGNRKLYKQDIYNV